MKKSDSIANLAGALSALQGQIQDVYKSKQGYGYKYAELSQILDTVRPLLSKHKLAVAQFPGAAGDKVALETVIMHESGEWISRTMVIPAERGKGMSAAQAVGSVISYARRYALASVLGIAQTDNDAAIQGEPIKLWEQVEQAIKDKNIDEDKVSKMLEWAKVSSFRDANNEQLQIILQKIGV